MGQNAGKPLQNVKNPTPLEGVGLMTPDRPAPDGAKAARSGRCWSPGPDHGRTSASSVNAHGDFANIFHIPGGAFSYSLTVRHGGEEPGIVTATTPATKGVATYE